MSVAGDVLGSIHNFFELAPARGTFEASHGTLSAVRGAMPALAADQYYLVRGSVMNDGLHEWGHADLADEGPFEGCVVPCAVPADLRAVIAEIGEWRAEHGSAPGPYQSESFDGYAYSLASDSQTGAAVTWQAAFRSHLNRWRRL